MTNAIQQALQVLRDGGLILYPTDTLWGIGCDATNEKAVKKVYELKQRADSKSLIILASDMGMIGQYVKQIPDIAYNLTEVSDTPLTLIYPQARNLAANAVAEDETVAIRISNHDFCQQLLHKFHKPIISTSANISGEATPKTFSEISDVIKNGVDFIVGLECEGKPTRKPSSIIKIGLNAEIEVIRG